MTARWLRRNLETNIHGLLPMVLSILTGHLDDRLTQASLRDPPHQERRAEKAEVHLMPNSKSPV